jgi:RNA polymerase sigma factor (sigma-70 family)
MRVVQKDKVTESIVTGILNNDNATIVMIYKQYLSSIRKLVYNYNRPGLNADDVFQEGLTRAVVNIRDGKFRGDSSFHSYFYAICRNICLKELKKGGLETDMPDNLSVDDESRQWDLVEQVLKLREKIDGPCREIIDLRFNINRLYTGAERLTPFEYIAEQFGIQTDNARQRFRRCMGKLTELFYHDPVCREIIN